MFTVDSRYKLVIVSASLAGSGHISQQYCRVLDSVPRLGAVACAALRNRIWTRLAHGCSTDHPQLTTLVSSATPNSALRKQTCLFFFARCDRLKCADEASNCNGDAIPFAMTMHSRTQGNLPPIGSLLTAGMLRANLTTPDTYAFWAAVHVACQSWYGLRRYSTE